MTNLDNYRQQIDRIDAELVSLLARRLAIVKQVGEYKKAQGIPPLDESRWQEVLESKMKQAEEHGINPELIKAIWNRIHEEALAIEAK